MTDFADTMVMHDAQDFVDARILEEFIDEPAPAVTGSPGPVNFLKTAAAVWV